MDQEVEAPPPPVEGGEEKTKPIVLQVVQQPPTAGRAKISTLLGTCFLCPECQRKFKDDDCPANKKEKPPQAGRTEFTTLGNCTYTGDDGPCFLCPECQGKFKDGDCLANHLVGKHKYDHKATIPVVRR
jgi:hypothetical protein